MKTIKTIKLISLTIMLAFSLNAFSTDSDGGNSDPTSQNNNEGFVQVCFTINEATGEKSCVMVKV